MGSKAVSLSELSCVYLVSCCNFQETVGKGRAGGKGKGGVVLKSTSQQVLKGEGQNR